MKSFKPILITILVIAALAAIKIFFFPARKTGQKPGGGPGGKNEAPVAVTAMVVRETPLQNSIYITGNLLSSQDVQLMPERGGKVTGIYFKDGVKVQKGQLLLKLNDATMQAQLKKLQLQQKLSADKEGRLKQLLAVNGISQQEYDIAQNELSGIKADIELLQAQIAETEIRAPFNGVMGLTQITEGSYVTPNTIITSIRQTDVLKLDFYIPERYASRIRTGDTIYFTSETSSDNSAVIAAVEPNVDPSTQTLRIRALTNNINGKNIPGSMVKINLPLSRNELAIMIPTEAITTTMKGKKVFVSRNKIAEEVMIETGVRTESHLQVTKGLTVSDTLIVTGILQIKKGSPLNIISVK